MSPLDFSVEELDQLLDLASDIEKHPKKYAHACDTIYAMNRAQEHD